MVKIDFPFLIVAKIRILFNNVKNIIIFLNTNLTNSTNNKQKTRKTPSYSISLSDFCSISSYMFFMSKLLSPYPLNSAPGYVRLYYRQEKTEKSYFVQMTKDEGLLRSHRTRAVAILLLCEDASARSIKQ